MGATTPHKRDRRIFYVYEYWRPDTGRCFWVGKGHGDRAHKRRSRNFHFDNVVAFLERRGLSFEVRIIRGGMTEREALDFEIDQIAYRRSQNEPLTNITDGGEGTCGLTHSAKTRAALSEKSSRQSRRPCPEAVKHKISAAQAGRKKGPNPAHSERLKGRKLSEDHRAKISAGMRGRTLGAETRAKIGAANRGKERSAQTRENQRRAHLGKCTTEETRAKMSASHKARHALMRGF